MTADIFESWLIKLDQQFLHKGRNILLFVDNCTAHKSPPLKAIKLVFFPPNCTSHLQPCDQGIIASLKSQYRQQILRCIVQKFDADKTILQISLLDGMVHLVKAWDMVTPLTVKNCFRKAGFCIDDSQPEQLEPGTEHVQPNSGNVWERIGDIFPLGENESYEDYLIVDSEVTGAGLPTTDSIVADIQPDSVQYRRCH
jgi:hypothetical protein